jgi:putative adenylate-forming enzyme
MFSALLPFRVIWRRHRLERSCTWSRRALVEHQQRKLAALRSFARERSPFYQRFHRGLDQSPLERLPILTKAEMMEHFDELVTDRSVRLADAEAFLQQHPGDGLFRERYVVLSTSGSTGRRGVFLFDEDEWLTALALISRPIAWAGVTRGSLKPPRAAVIASTTPWHYSTRIGASLSSPLLPSLRLDASEPLSAMVAKLNEWQPEVLAAYPSVLSQLAEEQRAGRLSVRLRSVATSAEVLPDETRARVHQAWGVRVYDTYGATEYAPIAAECPSGRRHLLEDGAVIEVVDERGHAVPEGTTGERLLLTVFNRRTQPLIRYELSDMIRLGGDRCECGRPFRVIDAIEGRIEDVLSLSRADGGHGMVSVHPNMFHELLESVPASGWQVQQEGTQLRINLTGVKDQDAIASLANVVQAGLARHGATASAIHVRLVDALTRGATGKAPLIMADRAGSGDKEIEERRQVTQ